MNNIVADSWNWTRKKKNQTELQQPPKKPHTKKIPNQKGEHEHFEKYMYQYLQYQVLISSPSQ